MAKSKNFDIYPPVFYPAIAIIALFIFAALTFTAHFEQFLSSVHDKICDNLGWLIIMTANFFLFFCLYCAFSRFGKIRIGGKDAKPEFSFSAWFSMLFTAGMGAGGLFFGVAEPISHFNSHPMRPEEQLGMVENAFQWTFLHFGFHGWATYLMVGLAVALATFNRGLPLTFSATFQPLLKDKVKSFWGNAIDITTVIANLFGVALSLTIAAQLLSNGVNRLFGFPEGLTLQLVIITCITLAATISVVLGLRKGIKILSSLNIRLALLMLGVMLFLGPTVFILDSFVQNTGAYVQQIISLGTWADAGSGRHWQNDWTVFFWIWWMAWAPFVGIFIARISKGRTVRELILYGLSAPCLLTFFWFSVFGCSALYVEMQTAGIISDRVQENLANGFFEMLQHYPFTQFTSLVFLFLASIFFVTSSDSASLVNDFLTSGGKINAPKGQRIFWAVTEGIVAAILLGFGGLGLINGAITLFGFAFMFVLMGMCWSMYKGLKVIYSE